MFDIYWYDYQDCNDIKALIEVAKKSSKTEYIWLAHCAVDYSNFDWRWFPNRHQKNFYHAWPSHNKDCLTTWLIPTYIEFDKTEKVFHDKILPILKKPNYITDERINYYNFDFSWFPSVWEWKYRHEFTMLGTKQLSYTTLLKNNNDIKYHESKLYWNNDYCFDKYWYDYDDCDDINRIIKLAQENSKTPYVWICHKSVDYKNFNFKFLPELGQENSYHAWASHDNFKCFTTWLVPKIPSSQFVYHSGLLPIIKNASGRLWNWKCDPLIDYKNFNFNWFPDVYDWDYNHEFTMLGKERLSYTTLDRKSGKVKYHAANLTYDKKHYDICCIDTKTHNLPPHDYKVNLVTTIDDTLKAALKKATRPWLWVISDVCDYENFDFNWLPEEGEEHQIHCWPSGSCEKGDTFLIYVPSHLNDWNPSYNFNHTSITRKPWPVIYYNSDSLTNLTFSNKAIYTLFTKTILTNYDVCLWDKRPVVSLSTDNSISLIPRDCIVKSEIYEYSYLLKKNQVAGQLQDIIFISYDEPEAEENFKILRSKFDNVKRIHGVNGMENALQAAAEISSTPWFYAVFAKTQVHENFNFDYMPDYWQKPKHYIFYAKNIVNDLSYGHMGIVLYNKNMVLNAPKFGAFGTDYTLSFAHEVVPIISCYGKFNSSPYHTWRTAFREVHKLCEYADTTYCIETQYRINTWLNNAQGSYAEWSINGARDGQIFYKQYKNNKEYRRNTFRWEWLRSYFTELYGNIN